MALLKTNGSVFRTIGLNCFFIILHEGRNEKMYGKEIIDFVREKKNHRTRRVQTNVLLFLFHIILYFIFLFF